MMRIAIAGSGTFASSLAHEIGQTGHIVVVLSRTPQPEFESQYECQVLTVNYHDPDALRFALRGMDLVISTFRSVEQILLIDAAQQAGVSRFVPAEFEGSIGQRPENDILGNHSSIALQALRQHASSGPRAMKWTVFSCGIFYERFAPGGLRTYGMGESEGIANQGDYLVNIGTASADLVETNAMGHPATVSMTSLYDVAKFVAAAIELGPADWPKELRMRGDKMSVRDIFAACSIIRGETLSIRTRPYARLDQDQHQCEAAQNWPQWWYIERLRATANGRYDFGHANLNELVSRSDVTSVKPVKFSEWLSCSWLNS